MNLDFGFTYQEDPVVPLLIIHPETRVAISIFAFLDTGAEATMLDESVASRLGLDLSDAPTVALRGLGGRSQGKVGHVELQLLESAELAVSLDVAFVVDIESSLGNLLGLDLLSEFDLGLSHKHRQGFLGRTSA
jgi:predicted aspartyl protease